MKRKLLLALTLMIFLACMLAICISADTFIIYENEVADDNELYRFNTAYEGRNRYEMTQGEPTGKGFAKVDSEGNPLTWYAISHTEATVDSVVTHTIVVKAIKTIGEAGTVTDGKFTFGGAVEGVTAKNVVSINFQGTGITTFEDKLFYNVPKTAAPGHATQFCKYARAEDLTAGTGSHLLFLYLPKTMTAIPSYFVARSFVRVIEFEDNKIACTVIPQHNYNGTNKEYDGPFQFCANLKECIIPEGIETIYEKAFRECMSISYVKFPSTLKTLPNNVFFRCILFEKVVFGENMTSIGYLNGEAAKTYNTGSNNSGLQRLPIKYIYVPGTLDVTGTAIYYFDTYRGVGNNNVASAANRSLVFFVNGDLDYVKELQKHTDTHFGGAPTVIDYQTYLANKDHYDNLPTDENITVTYPKLDGTTATKTGKGQNHVIVYGLNLCDMYYEGEHVLSSSTDSCLIEAKCTRNNKCTHEVVSKKFTSHVSAEGIFYKDGFAMAGVHKIYCSNSEGCKAMEGYSETEKAPIFTSSGGYSTNGNGGIDGGWIVNNSLLKEYNAMYPDAPVRFGVIVFNPAHLKGDSVFDENKIVALADGKKGAIQVEVKSPEYAKFSVEITGLSAYSDLELVIASYFFAGDGSIHLLQDQKTTSHVSEIVKTEGTLYTVNYAKILQSSQIPETTDALLPTNDEQ